jgi:antirestriction protein ArdC
LGSAFLSADLDLMPELRGDHASYIASWIKVLGLRDDKRAIFTAASQAQRAADFLQRDHFFLGDQPQRELQKSASAQANAA